MGRLGAQVTDGFFNPNDEGCDCKLPEPKWLGVDKSGWRCIHGYAWALQSMGEFPNGYYAWSRAVQYDLGLPRLV